MRVDGTGRFKYQAFWLSQPNRLVLDFTGAAVRVPQKSLSSNVYPVRLVRIGQFKSDVARVVIETEVQLPYTIAASSDVVTVVFGTRADAKAPAAAKKQTFNIYPAVPRGYVPGAGPDNVENNQDAKLLTDASVPTAQADPSREDAGRYVPIGARRQSVQQQEQPTASVSGAQFPQPEGKGEVSGYVLGPDDEIVIRGIEAPELPDKSDSPILIGTNGAITVPLIGRVEAGGLTVEQLEGELNARFKEYIKEPRISVTVTEFRSQPVSVFGAVTKPGVVQLRGGRTLFEVLSMAGGPRDTAGSLLTVTRPIQNGKIPLPGAKADVTGQFSSVELNVQEILEGKNPTENIEIKPNDIISVSEASANMIYVVGDVEKAGAFTLGGQKNISVLKAVSLAGGLGRTANSGKARIVREVPGEAKPVEIAVNIEQIFTGKTKDVQLGPNDVLVVPSSTRKAFATSFIPGTISTAVSAAIYRY